MNWRRVAETETANRIAIDVGPSPEICRAFFLSVKQKVIECRQTELKWIAGVS